MSKRKRSQKVVAVAAWSDLEQAFFAAAPPDEPEAPAQLADMDEPAAPTCARRSPSGLGRVLVAVRGLLASGSRGR